MWLLSIWAWRLRGRGDSGDLIGNNWARSCSILLSGGDRGVGDRVVQGSASSTISLVVVCVIICGAMTSGSPLGVSRVGIASDDTKDIHGGPVGRGKVGDWVVVHRDS